MARNIKGSVNIGKDLDVAGDITVTGTVDGEDIAAVAALGATALQDLTADALSTLSDVTITGIASGELLKWNGSAWINNTIAEAGLATSAQGSTADSALQDLTGDALETLSDVTITGIASGELLKWNGSAWINNTIAEAGLATAAQGSTADTALQDLTADALSTLSDVTITTITDNEVLRWNGSAWINNTLAELGVATSAQGSTADSAMQDLIDDVAPVLGAALDVGGFAIVSNTAGDIALTPDTTGDVILDGLKWPQADGTANYVLETDGAGQLSWATNAGGGGMVDLVDDATPQLGGDLSANGNQIQWSKGADVASATALVLLTDGNYFNVTGTTTVTSFATTAVGTVIKLHFDAAVLLTHHTTDLVLPGAANYTTAAGDELEFVEYAAGDYRCTGYALASGESMVAGAGGATGYLYTDTPGTDPVGTGAGTVVIGDGATGSTHNDAVVIGNGASASYNDVVVIGKNANAGSGNKSNVAIGSGAKADGNRGVAIGDNALVDGSNSTSIGGYSYTSGTGCTAVGAGSYCHTGDENTAIGTNAVAFADNTTVIGYDCGVENASYTNTILIGTDSLKATGGDRVEIGTNATTNKLILKDTGQLSLVGTLAQIIAPNYITGSLPTGTTGGIAYDTTTNELKVFDSTWNTIGSGIASVLADTSPQLGGDLDTNGKYIVFDSGFGIKGTTSDNMMVKFIDGASHETRLEITTSIHATDTVTIGTDDDSAGDVDLLFTAQNGGNVEVKANNDFNVLGGDINITDGSVVMPIQAQTDTAHTLVIGDSGGLITMDNGSANTLTIPLNSSVAFTIGTKFTVIQKGAGATDVTGVTGVTLNGVTSPTGGGVITAQYDEVALYKVGTDEWLMTGSHSAVT